MPYNAIDPNIMYCSLFGVKHQIKLSDLYQINFFNALRFSVCGAYHLLFL